VIYLSLCCYCADSD